MKVLLEGQSKTRVETIRYIGYAITLLLLAVVHLTLLDFISVGGLTPDLILILCVWVTLYEGPFIGLFVAFGSGLLLDIVSLDVIGTNALAKVTVAFIAGYFYKEGDAEKTIGSYKFLLIVMLSSFVHNIIYFFFYLKPSDSSFLLFFLKYGIAITLYTTVFAVFAMLSKIRRK